MHVNVLIVCTLLFGGNKEIYLSIYRSLENSKIMLMRFQSPLVYVPMSSILLAGTGVWKSSSVACWFNSIKLDYSDYPKSLISRINEVYVFVNKISLYRAVSNVNVKM